MEVRLNNGQMVNVTPDEYARLDELGYIGQLQSNLQINSPNSGKIQPTQYEPLKIGDDPNAPTVTCQEKGW